MAQYIVRKICQDDEKLTDRRSSRTGRQKMAHLIRRKQAKDWVKSVRTSPQEKYVRAVQAFRADEVNKV